MKMNSWIEKPKMPAGMKSSSPTGKKIAPDSKMDHALKSKKPSTVQRAKMIKTLRGLRK